MTSYLERKRSTFLLRNGNVKNCLLEIPIPVPINLKKTSNPEDSRVNGKGNFENSSVNRNRYCLKFNVK